MNDRTPLDKGVAPLLDEDVRSSYVEWQLSMNVTAPIVAGADFDSWLAAVRAEAWYRGFVESRSYWAGGPDEQNPYREVA